MDRRTLLASGLGLLAGPALAQEPTQLPPAAPAPGNPPAYPAQPYPPGNQSAYPTQPPPPANQPAYPANTPAESYSRSEIVNAASDFFGVTSEALGAVIEKAFKDNGQPTGYIAGEEGAGAVTIGLRYGKGLLYMKNRQPETVYWQGPSIGWDLGGNASRVFTLVYGIRTPEEIYQRFPGVEGSAYIVGGVGLNYQRGDEITLAPIRTGVGLRLGANVGYLAYTRTRHILPF